MQDFNIQSHSLAVEYIMVLLVFSVSGCCPMTSMCLSNAKNNDGISWQ